MVATSVAPKARSHRESMGFSRRNSAAVYS
jgi:hypothetical protein